MMKQNIRMKALVSLVIAFAMCLAAAFAFTFTGKVSASTANPYEVGVNATSTPVTREGKTAYQISLEGEYGCRAAYENPVDITKDFSMDLYDVSEWPVGELANSLFIAFTNGFNRFYNEEYVNGVTLGLFHKLTENVHTFELVLYKGWVGSPYTPDGVSVYATPAVASPAGDKLTIELGYSADQSTWDISLNGGKVSVPADLFGTGKTFYPEADVSMNNLYMMVSSMTKGKITVSAPGAEDPAAGIYEAAVAAIAEYKALVDANITTQAGYDAAMAKRAEINLAGLTAEQTAELQAQITAIDLKLDEALAYLSFDNRTPFAIGTGGNGTVGSRLISVNGTNAYKLGLIPGSNGGFACRVSSNVAYDLTSLEFDILRASESIVQTRTDTAMQTFIGFTDGENRYLTEDKTSLTLAFEHTVEGSSHSYKLLFCRGWFENTWLTDGSGALYEMVVTDPADDKLSIKFSVSENGANLNVSFNEKSVAIPMSMFGPGTNMYEESADAIHNVYFIYGTMNMGNNSMVVANISDSKIQAYQATDAYKNAMEGLSEYIGIMGDGIADAAECIEAIECKNGISTAGLRSYDVNYINAILAAYEPTLQAARTQYAAELLDFDITAYENAVDAIADVQGSFNAQALKALIDETLLAAAPESAARVAAADALFTEKTDATAKAVAADILAQLNAAKTAEAIRVARALKNQVTPAYLAFLSTEALAEVNAQLAEIETKLGELMTVADWSMNGNAIMTRTEDETLNFIGSAYAGISSTDGSVLPLNDAIFYDKAFQITNFSMDFVFDTDLQSGWFSIALMTNKNDVFSAQGDGEAATSKHKGIMIWLQPQPNNRVGITVFAIKDDTTQIYAGRKTEMMYLDAPADGVYSLRMYQAPDSNELSMLLNGTDILASKIRIPELNTIYGAKTDPAQHVGYLTVIGSVGNDGDYFDFEISRINGKNVFAADITTPDPSNVPEKQECQHQYDPDTGYCILCGELNPDFDPNGGDGDKGGCGSSVGAMSLFAAAALLAVAAILIRKKRN